MYLTESARRPIKPEAPAGIDPKNLDAFMELKREINKINTITGNVDWEKIKTISNYILVNESKDFRCACYYSVACSHIDGIKGLAEGLSTLLDFCVIYWFSAFPERHRSKARIQTFEWMLENIQKAFSQFQVKEQHLLLLETTHTLSLKLEEELIKQLGKNAPSLRSIRKQTSEWIDDINELIEERTRAQQECETQSTTCSLTNTPEQKNSSDSLGMPSDINSDSKKRHKTPAFYYLIASLFTLFIFFWGFVNLQVLYYKSAITSQIPDKFLTTLTKIETSDQYIQKKLKDVVLIKAEELVDNWHQSPRKVINNDELYITINKVVGLYPNSLKALEVKRKFQSNAAILQREYKKLSETSYAVNNLLLPQIEDIQCIDNDLVKKKAIDKIQLLLNTYQYKLNEYNSSL